MRKNILFFLILALFVFSFSLKRIYFSESNLSNVSSSALKGNKVLICGVGKNIEDAASFTISSMEKLGKKFSDYRVIIYENNSTDHTVEIFQNWAKKNSKVVFLTEKLSSSQMKKEAFMKVSHRIEKLSSARNKLLSYILRKEFDDYGYVIMADLDFLHDWSIDEIVKTIQLPEREFDAVFANGAYDHFAIRSKINPIGFELLGDQFFKFSDEITQKLQFSDQDPWIEVYSGFGGLGIYKRDSLKGCKYSAIVTEDLQNQVKRWLAIELEQNLASSMFQKYQSMQQEHPIIDDQGLLLDRDELYPDYIGIRLKKDLISFAALKKSTYPWTCEHLNLHASMAEKGFGKFFINPRIHMHWTEPHTQKQMRNAKKEK